jgi:hypothetical protein
MGSAMYKEERQAGLGEAEIFFFFFEEIGEDEILLALRLKLEKCTI